MVVVEQARVARQRHLQSADCFVSVAKNGRLKDTVNAAVGPALDTNPIACGARLVGVDYKVVALAGINNERGDFNRLNETAIARYHRQRVIIDGELDRTIQKSGVDEPKAVAVAVLDAKGGTRRLVASGRERLLRGAATVDEHRCRLVVAVVVVVAGELGYGRLVDPIVDHDDVIGQIVIVQVSVRIVSVILAHDERAKYAIGALCAGMRMPEVSASVGRVKLVHKMSVRYDGTLGDEAHAVHVRRASLFEAVPLFFK